ncbi:hypothetical protein WG906_02620 [Pedobacter sp. P351]|uniref:hypothetical protein n=1 Tax=Pedobacter superstes TaxID=3133441 RepID=UPI0030948C1D
MLSCEKESIHIDKENTFNIPFTSSLNEHVVIQNELSRIFVQVKNISDNRCQDHLNCSDPGEASVRIEVSNISNSKAETLLHLGSVNYEYQDSDSVTLNLDGRLYSVYLTGVNPHPMLESNEIQTAEILVKLKN